MSRILKHILSQMNLNGSRLGIHSLWMLAVTFAHGAASSKVSQFITTCCFCIDTTNKNYFILIQDDIDYHGRWKNSSRQHETYASTSIPYVDDIVATSLCTGGVCIYFG